MNPTLQIAFTAFAFFFFFDFTEAAETSSQGELRLEFRGFQNDDRSETQDFGAGMAGRLEITDKRGSFSSRGQIFSRVDIKDPQRQRLNLEELYTQYETGAFELFLGWKTLNWSTAEAFHPTDVINSRNFDSNFENAEKLGEFMLGQNYIADQWSLSAFFMPLLTAPQLPDSNNRLSFLPLGVPSNPLVFLNNQGEFMDSSDTAEQWALRTQYQNGDFELNLAWVHHFDRTDIKALNTGVVLPVMTPVEHYGLGMNYVYDAFIFKTEAVYRDFKDEIFVPSLGAFLTQRDYGLISLASEYTASHGNGSESTWILEFQEILGVPQSLRYGIVPFQRDILLGWRYAANDSYSKEFLISAIADLERTREILLSLRYSQRLSDVWKVQSSVRYIDAPSENPIDFTGIRQLNNDHQVNLTISRFF